MLIMVWWGLEFLLQDWIANTLGVAIERSSSSENYSKEFQSIKAQKEKHKINFKKTNRNLCYN